VDVRHHAAEWISDDIADADRRGQMKGKRVLRHESVDEIRIEHGPADDAERGLVAMASKVALGSGCEIVEHSHGVTHVEQPIDEVGADETAASSNENRS
jgi:hypothetical protein